MTDDDSLARLRQIVQDDVGQESTSADLDVDALLDGRLPSADAQALAARSLDDGDLALQIRVAHAMRQARADQTEAASVVSMDPHRGRRLLWSAVFAVAAGLLVFVWLRPPTLTPTDSSTIRAGAQPVASLVRSKSLPADAFVLEWTASPDAASYDLYVTTTELVSVHQALDLPQPRYTVPPQALEPVESGSSLLWRVTLVTSEGRRINSPAFQVEVE